MSYSFNSLTTNGNLTCNTGNISLNGSTCSINPAGALTLKAFNCTGAVAMGSNKITGLGEPSANTDGATKAYVDSVALGFSVKAPVRVKTTGNITLTGAGSLIADGVTLILNDRILVANQTTQSQNGIYTVTTANPYVLTRSTDADDSPDGEVKTGIYVFIKEGTAFAGTSFVLTAFLGTINTDSQVYTQVSQPLNTFTNTGTGTGIYKGVNGNSQEFKSLIATSTKIALTSNSNDVSIDVIQANITGTGVLASGSITNTFGNIATGGTVSGSNLALTNTFTTTGNFPLTLNKTASTNVTLPTSGTLATTSDVSTAGNAKLSLTGGSMTGAIAMGTNKITGLGEPLNNTDASTKLYADSKVTAPTTAVINESIAVFDGTLGKTIKQSSVKITGGDVTGVTTLTATGAVSSSNLSVGGLLTTTNPITLTTSGITTVTLPTSGTLATTTDVDNIIYTNWVRPAMTSLNTPVDYEVSTNSSNGTVYWKAFDDVVNEAGGHYWHTVGTDFSGVGYTWSGVGAGKQGIPANGAWIVLKLANMQFVSQYTIYPRMLSSDGRAVDWYLIYSIDGTNYSIGHTVTNNPTNTSSPIINNITPVLAKYIGIQVTKSNSTFSLINDISFKGSDQNINSKTQYQSTTSGITNFSNNGISTKSITLDPNSETGGALIITNTSAQTSGALVSMRGNAGQTVLRIVDGDIDMYNMNMIRNLYPPQSDYDAATKSYADSKVTAPTTAVINESIAVFDGTLGKTIKQSAVKISNVLKLPINDILTTYGTTSLRLGLRKLSSTYTGACVNVTASSITIDIGFDANGILDYTTFTTLTGAVYVNKWYDQSGNVCNCTGGGTVKPLLTFPLVSGIRVPTITFNNSRFTSVGSCQALGLDNPNHAIITTMKSTTVNTTTMFLHGSSSSSSNELQVSGGQGARVLDDGGVVFTDFGTNGQFTNTNWHMLVSGALFDGTQNSAGRGDLLSTVSNLNNQITTGGSVFVIGVRGNGTSPLYGDVTEVIVFSNSWIADSTAFTNYYNDTLTYRTTGVAPSSPVLSMNNNIIMELATPIASTDGANKAYVDIAKLYIDLTPTAVPINVSGRVYYDANLNNLVYAKNNNWYQITSSLYIPTPFLTENLKGWFDASNASSISQTPGNVTVWNDLSSSGFNLTGITATPRTGDTTVNGKNVVNFDGTECIYRPGTVVNYYRHTIIIVSTATVAAMDIYGSGGHIGTGDVMFTVNTNGTYRPHAFRTGDGLRDSIFTLSTDMSIRIQRVGATTMDIIENGDMKKNYFRFGGTDPAVLKGIYLGFRSHQVGNGFIGSMGEVLVFDTNISDSRLNIIGNYLGNKWGVTWTNLV